MHPGDTEGGSAHRVSKLSEAILVLRWKRVEENLQMFTLFYLFLGFSQAFLGVDTRERLRKREEKEGGTIFG